jgi:hypothetical protein
MTKIQLITFKGCQTTIKLRSQLETLTKTGEIDAQVETIVVASPNEAEKTGLFGSPTMLVNGVEYQQDRRGPAGFY